MNKIVHIPAYFAPVGKDKTVKVPTGEKTKGFFGGEKDEYIKEKQWIQTGYSDSIVDGDRLSSDLSKAIESLNEDGFEVISVSPITSGAYSWNTHVGGSAESTHGHGYGYGYSYTSSLLVTAKKSS